VQVAAVHDPPVALVPAPNVTAVATNAIRFGPPKPPMAAVTVLVAGSITETVFSPPLAT
jgi:hypothetical protein